MRSGSDTEPSETLMAPRLPAGRLFHAPGEGRVCPHPIHCLRAAPCSSWYALGLRSPSRGHRGSARRGSLRYVLPSEGVVFLRHRNFTDRGVRRSGQRQPTVSLRVGRTPPSPVAGAETRREGGWRVDSVVGIQSGSTFSLTPKTEYRGKSVQNLLFFQSADVFGRIVSVKAVFWVFALNF